MNYRERVINALNFRPVDKPPVEVAPMPVGFYEHGEKLNDLYEQFPGDFDPYERQPIPVVSREHFDADGRYYEQATDDWGTKWEFRVYGMMGHAIGFPVTDYESMAAYSFPKPPAFTDGGQGFDLRFEQIKEHRKKYFARQNINIAIVERLSAVMGFDRLLTELYDDGPEINAFLDRLTDYYVKTAEAAAKLGVEGITMGDDLGTQRSLIMSTDLFKHAILPRYRRVIEPLKKAGLHVHFHSCGKIDPLFELLRGIGVDSVWPQLPVYDMKELAYTLKSLGLAIALHTDRAFTMQSGTPEQVRELVGLENEIFKPRDGGSWFYVEVDTQFPFENIKALVESVNSL